MNDETREALEASIKHWQKNVEAETPNEVSLGAASCPLCALFNVSEDDDINCVGCPVAERAHAQYCAFTPFVEVYFAVSDWRSYPHNVEKRKAFQEAAKAELGFLISLRPAKGV